VIAGDPLIICDRRSRVVAWNAAAEALTGLPASTALGMPCWDAVHGVDAAGGPVCRPGCGYARRALAGSPLPAHEMYVGTADGGHRRVRASMISLPEGEEGAYAMVMQDQHDAAGPVAPEGARLTPRQREVLGLIADGLPVRAVARRLGISEATVRNYVRRILISLHCHSHLEAVAAARRAGLV
jgi:DNA-binding CsgD family transcriptional regulator